MAASPERRASPESDWQRLTDEQLAHRIIEDIYSVQENGLIRLMCGSGRPDVFNDDFVGAVRDVRKHRQARIALVTAPMLVLDGQGENAVWTVVKNGWAEEYLHHPTVAAAFPRFRLVDVEHERYRFSEETRPLGYQTHEHAVRTITGPRDSGRQEGAAVVFNNTVRMLRDDPKAKRPPILLTRTEIHALEARAEALDFHPDYLTLPIVRRLHSLASKPT